MDVVHITAFNEDRASFRYRVLIPGAQLHELWGWNIGVADTPEEGAVNIFHKHGKAHKADGGRYIFDVCDNHFATEHREHYVAMCQGAEVVVACTPTMAEQIHAETGMRAEVIPDPFEFPERGFEWYGGESVLWYGHGSNFRTLQDVPLDCAIEMITNAARPGARVNARITPWSREAMLEAFDRHDTVIIPQFQDAKSRSKGNNRAVNALRQGKFVVASDIPSYRELSDYIYIGEIMDGVRWGRQNPDAVAAMVAAGQAYVANQYSPARIAGLWADIITAFEAAPRVRSATA
jgi:hypothetical protein